VDQGLIFNYFLPVKDIIASDKENPLQFHEQGKGNHKSPKMV
jgi:hypothetical protein